MKKCNYCGKEYPDDASTCAADGQLLHAMPPPPPAPFPVNPDAQRVIDDEHIRLLSIFHFVIAGLAFCGIGFLVLHYLIMSTLFSNPDFFKNQPNAPAMPKDMFKFFIWFYIIFGVVFAIAATANLLSGIFLRQKKHRLFSLVVGGLNCLQIPFGTLLGVFTIIVLSRESVRKSY